jgi:hypothetical protein
MVKLSAQRSIARRMVLTKVAGPMWRQTVTPPPQPAPASTFMPEAVGGASAATASSTFMPQANAAVRKGVASAPTTSGTQPRWTPPERPSLVRGHWTPPTPGTLSRAPSPFMRGVYGVANTMVPGFGTALRRASVNAPKVRDQMLSYGKKMIWPF